MPVWLCFCTSSATYIGLGFAILCDFMQAQILGYFSLHYCSQQKIYHDLRINMPWYSNYVGTWILQMIYVFENEHCKNKKI